MVEQPLEFCISFCSGVTQIEDLERSCIALIRQIIDLDKGVKKCINKSRCTEKCITLICYHANFNFSQYKYAEIEYAFLPNLKIHTYIVVILKITW